MSQLRRGAAETAATPRRKTREISGINRPYFQAAGLWESCLTLVGADAPQGNVNVFKKNRNYR
jgi:hypothetical protein